MASDGAEDAKGSQSKVVRLKLRYKSATVDAFIEKYALDVSPRGIYVNIARPLAVGTPVSLEIQLASEQVVIKGTGSIVWNRDRAQASGTRPAGLWIKFVQIDEPSKAFIEELVRVRADAGLAYEAHAEQEAEDANVVGSPAQSHQEAPALPVPAALNLRATLVGVAAPALLPVRPRLPSLPAVPALAPAKAPSLPAPPVPAGPRLRATLVGIAAPGTLPPPRARLSSLPPGHIPLPAKTLSVPPSPGRASEEQGETDAEDATVTWGEVKAASTHEGSLTEVTAPAPLPPRPRLPSLPPAGSRLPSLPPVRPRLASLPPPRPRLASLPPPRASSLPKAWPAPPPPARAYEDQSEKDAEEDTVIWEHEPSHQEVSASPLPPMPGASVLVATAQQEAVRVASLKATVIGRRSPLAHAPHRWVRTGAWVASGLFAAVALALAMRSTEWFRALTTEAAAPDVSGGGATSAATAMSSAETAPVPVRDAVEASADAPPAATTPAEVAEAPPIVRPPTQAIAVPVPAPGPKPAPAATRAPSPIATGISTVRAKPKPKPAPTIDDGF